MPENRIPPMARMHRNLILPEAQPTQLESKGVVRQDKAELQNQLANVSARSRKPQKPRNADPPPQKLVKMER